MLCVTLQTALSENRLFYLDDIAVGALGVNADSHSEEGLSSVWPGNYLQNLHEVVLVPRPSDVPTSSLYRETKGSRTFKSKALIKQLGMNL